MDDGDLQVALLKAHGAGDHMQLVHLYTQAADMREVAGEVDAACFFLTHAYVFALEQGAEEAVALNKRLADYGRAELISF